MADTTTPNSAFSDIVQKIADAEVPAPRKRAQPTTIGSLLKSGATEYPRATATAVIGGTAGYNAIKNYQNNYKEGWRMIQDRLKQEKGMVKGMVKKGLGGFPRLADNPQAIRSLAKEYALEKTFTGFPFYNTQAEARIADLKIPRVILNAEGVPLTNIMVPAVPKQVTKEGLKAIGKPFTSDKKPTAGRVAEAKGYVPTSGVTPSIPRRIAELGTGGKFGKFMVGGEALALGADILNEEGDIQRAYREGDKSFGVAGGLTLGGLKTLSRAGRGATNALTLGAPEYLGVYDTIDILQARSEARENYMASRDKLKLPVKREGKDLVPVEGPYLQMFEAQALANRGIASSPIIEDFYKGPDYDYKVHEGKLTPLMKPEYASRYEANTESMLANQLRYRDANVLNVDPTLGKIGYPRTLDPSKNEMLYGGYGDDGFVR